MIALAQEDFVGLCGFVCYAERFQGSPEEWREARSKHRHNSRTARSLESAGDCLALIAEAELPLIRALAPRPSQAFGARLRDHRLAAKGEPQARKWATTRPTCHRAGCEHPAG
jgi:hypothetical protein